ncbi:MAG TPA: MmgE/PrpD family protein, partial [Capillimicrobium sp.]
MRERAALVLADTVGAMRAGAAHPDYVRVERSLAAGHAAMGARSARVLSGDGRVDADTAAFLYGIAGTWLELDEAAAAGVHAAIHVAAAVLAVGQVERLPGSDVLDGFLAGYEAASALAEQLPVAFPVHPHAGLAGVGAALGAAVATRRDPLAAARIAATLPIVATWDACFEGATARHGFAGASAAMAVRAVALAVGGMSGAGGAATTLFGDILGHPGHAPGAPSLEHAAVLRSTIKHHAACLTCHTAIEAALTLGPVAPGLIDRVEIQTVAEVADKVTRQPVANELSTKFSLPYAVAAALVLGRSDPAAFAYDASVADVARRVRVSIDPDLPTSDHAMPAR